MELNPVRNTLSMKDLEQILVMNLIENVKDGKVSEETQGSDSE